MKEHTRWAILVGTGWLLALCWIVLWWFAWVSLNAAATVAGELTK
jgi:hypothetical protein